MNDEASDLSSKTWLRTTDAINKAGYMDGASDGQAAAFQSSFDIGYSQGFRIGLQFGYNDASAQNRGGISSYTFQDRRSINCQLCQNVTTLQGKVDNLYNIQEEKNAVFLVAR